jgi:hypothetical protein
VSLEFLEVVLAGFNLDRDLRDAIIGDLIEERAELAAIHGERGADRWLRWQIFRSVPAFAHGAIRSGGIRLLAATVGAAVAALLAVGISIRVSIVLWPALGPPEALERWVLVSLALDLAFGAAGGYLAARLGRAAPLGATLCFGVLGMALTLASSGEAHGGYQAALLLLLVPATVSGGWLRARHLAHPD